MRRARSSRPPPGAVALVVLSLLLGCRRDMYDQPRQKPLSRSDFFEDGASARQPPEGAVPYRGRGDDSPYASAGGEVIALREEPPFPIDLETLGRGRERYDIYCSPCHGLTGEGDGMIVQRGFKRPPSFHTDHLRAEPIGYFVDVIAGGFGVMPSYAVQVAPRDRWAIAAYVGALQLSQSATLSDLPAEDAARIEALQ
jgi:mono/diheme cytochrome c family protein